MTELQAFGENIWISEGPQVYDAGILFTTRMTIVRLSDGSIWIESPVPSSFDTLRRIVNLGPVRYLVAATPRHYWRLDEWHRLFPDAELWSARVTAITLKKGDLPLSGTLDDSPPAGWAEDIEQVVLAGSPLNSEALLFHKPSRTLIVGDVIMIQPRIKGMPFRNMVFAMGGVDGPQGGVSRDIQFSYLNREQARQSLQRVLAWDFERVIIAHGPCIEHDARQFVEHAFRWLIR